MMRLGAFLAAGLILSFALNPAPARASSKAGGIALVVVGSFLLAGGAVIYAARYTAEDLDSPATAYVVGGVGVASIVTGVIVLNKVEPEQKKSSLRLVPAHHGIALAYLF
jgi:predicted phage tail protein